MKKLCFLFFICFAAADLQAQMSLATCKKILQILPTTLQTLNANTTKDRVMDAQGSIGMTIRRVYGSSNSNVSIKIIGYSLSLNKAEGVLVEAANDPDRYVVADIGGYQAFIQKSKIEDGKIGYELLLPIDKALITLSTSAFTQDAVIAMAKTIPVAQIDSLIQ